MKTKITFLSLMVISLISITVDAQKLKITSGKLKSLSEHKSFNMVYSYDDGLKIGKKTEKEYVSEKIADKNKKEPGTGDAWAAKWHKDKEGGVFFDKLEILFNEVLEDHHVSGSRDNTNATCTIYFNVYYMDPGYNIGISRKPAYVSMTATFVTNENEIAEVDMVKAPGRGAGGYDFDVEYRISEAFEKTGKTLGKALSDVYK